MELLNQKLKIPLGFFTVYSPGIIYIICGTFIGRSNTKREDVSISTVKVGKMWNFVSEIISEQHYRITMAFKG